jgi:anti-sigma regulatory factor (Ser/Thr protein kinase)
MKSLRLQAQTGNLAHAVSFVTQCAKAHGFSEDRTRTIELVVEEAFVNVCMYAYEKDTGRIEITCNHETASGRLLIEIIDSGRPFNPLCSVPPLDKNADIKNRSIGGLGILIIIQMTDQVSYDRVGEFNRLTLTFEKIPKCDQQD